MPKTAVDPQTWRATSGYMLCATLAYLAFLVLPTGVHAHAGHKHGDQVASRGSDPIPAAQGRYPGKPDLQRLGDETHRYDPKSREYVIKPDGEPAYRVHYDLPASSTPASVGGHVALPSSEDAPVCASSGHRIVPVRAWSISAPTTADGAGTIRANLRKVNWKFIQQSQLSSGGSQTVELKVDCVGDTIAVHDVQVPMNFLGDGVNTKDGDVSSFDAASYVINYALGRPEDCCTPNDGSRAVKYAVFLDNANLLSPGGWGTPGGPWERIKSASDTWESPSVTGEGASNGIRTHSGWAAMGMAATNVVTHELLHAMGGAFTSTVVEPPPFSNPGYHCDDGIDVLCYQDGGTYTEARCPESGGYSTPTGVPIDCGFDTYFDAQSEAGEWLDRHWNIGGVENPYVSGGGPSVLGPPEIDPESDVNGDGRSDLVALHPDGSVTTHLGSGTNGTADFSGNLSSSLFFADGHRVVDVADVEGDGRADLVSLHSSGAAYVHGGLSSGSFEATPVTSLSDMQPVWSTATGVEPIAVADVSGDGRDDLIVFRAGKGVQVHLGQATKQFGSAVTSLTSVNSALLDSVGEYFLDAADVTGDGLADLVTASTVGGGEVRVYSGAANGSFSHLDSSSLDWAMPDGSGYEPVGVADVSGDGKAELVVATAGSVYVFAGRADGDYKTASPSGTWGGGGLDSSLFDSVGVEMLGLLDHDGDGQADLHYLESTGTLSRIRGLWTHTFTSWSGFQQLGVATVRMDRRAGDEFVNQKPVLLRTGCQPSGCIWPPPGSSESDVDGDGDSDLVALHGSGQANVYAGTASGFGAATSAVTLDPALFDGEGDYVIDVADVTGDRRADLVTAGSDKEGVSVHPGKADRTFGSGILSLPGAALSLNGSGPAEPIAVADVTGDGRGDMISHAYTHLSVSPGRADGTFATWEEGQVATNVGVDSALLDGSGHYFLDAIDVTGDRRADVVSMSTDGKAYVFKGKANGEFETGKATTLVNPIMDDGIGEEPIGLGDMNGDGRADLLTLSAPEDELKLRLGKEDGTFATATTPFASIIDSSLMDEGGLDLVGLLDYNRDSLADLVALNDTGDVLTYKAQLGGGAVTFASPATHNGEIETVRHFGVGHEFATEKPLIRRLGCTFEGCVWP